MDGNVGAEFADSFLSIYIVELSKFEAMTNVTHDTWHLSTDGNGIPRLSYDNEEGMSFLCVESFYLESCGSWGPLLEWKTGLKYFFFPFLLLHYSTLSR